MTLTRRNNDDLFSNIFGSSFIDEVFPDFIATSHKNRGFPRLGSIDTEGNYKFSLDVPGFNREDITISYDDGILQVVAEKQTVHNQTFRASVAHSESAPDLDPESFEAHLDLGVLTITAKTITKKPTGIQIKVK